MNADRGDVLWASDPFKDGASGRRWLAVSDESTPDQGDQFVCLAITSKGYHEEAVRVRTDDTLPTESYVLPWSVRTVEAEDAARVVGALDRDTVEEATAKLIVYVGARE